MATIAFVLSMPRNNSWNGRWSGDESMHVIVRSYRSQKVIDRILSKRRYAYSFGDGWVAAIDVSVVDAKESRKLRSASVGFSGYDWMVKSIETDGDIYGPMHPKPTPEAQPA